MRRRSRSRQLGAVVILALLALGVGGWYGPRMLMEARASADWPTVTGEVTGGEVLPPGKSGESWRLALRYRYELAGAVHTSNRWDVHGMRRFDTRAEAEAALGASPPGTEVAVHYDPEAPGEAVLRPGGTGRAWIMIGLGGLIALVAARMAGRLLIRRR